MNIVLPSNKSWSFFKASWRNCLSGALSYLVSHPLQGWSALYHRLRYPVLKRSVIPFFTPEGIRISQNHELIAWSHIFVERVLHDAAFLKEYQSTAGAVIIDVGANCGMFTAWLGSMNNTSSFICLEPYPSFCSAGIARTSDLGCQWLNVAASNKEGKISFYRGSLTTCKKPAVIKEEMIVPCIPLDLLAMDAFLIKIDTDGHSTEVLEGATELLQRTRHVIIEDETGLDLDRFFGSHWTRRKLPSGYDWLLTNTEVNPPIY